MGYPISFLMLVLSSTTWHFLEQAQARKLSFCSEIKIMPFFLPSIFMKSWILPTTMHCVKILCDYFEITTTTSSILILSPAVVVILYQAILHFILGFNLGEESVITSIIGNITSNARPINKTRKRHEAQVKIFFQIETLSSGALYSMLAAFCMAVTWNFEEKKDMWKAWISCGFVIMHFTFTQIYLRTNKGLGQLFSNQSKNQNIFKLTSTFSKRQDKSDNESNEQTESKLFKIALVIVSLLGTIALFGVIGLKMNTGKTLLSKGFFLPSLHKCSKMRCTGKKVPPHTPAERKLVFLV